MPNIGAIGDQNPGMSQVFGNTIQNWHPGEGFTYTTTPSFDMQLQMQSALQSQQMAEQRAMADAANRMQVDMFNANLDQQRAAAGAKNSFANRVMDLLGGIESKNPIDMTIERGPDIPLTPVFSDEQIGAEQNAARARAAALADTTARKSMAQYLAKGFGGSSPAVQSAIQRGQFSARMAGEDQARNFATHAATTNYQGMSDRLKMANDRTNDYNTQVTQRQNARTNFYSPLIGAYTSMAGTDVGYDPSKVSAQKMQYTPVAKPKWVDGLGRNVY